MFVKVCPYCKKEYQTMSRNQKFCSDECCKSYNKRLRKRRREYTKNKELLRLKSRSHSIAVEIYKNLVTQGIKNWECEVCKSTTDLEVHHRDFCYVNNTPSNLMLLCVNCHNAEHSRVIAELKAQNKTLDDYYDESFKPILVIK